MPGRNTAECHLTPRSISVGCALVSAEILCCLAGLYRGCVFAPTAVHPEQASLQLYSSAPKKRQFAICREAQKSTSAWQVWGWRGHDRRAVADLAAGQLFCSTAAHEHGHLAPKLRVKHQRPVLRIGRDICEPASRHRFFHTCTTPFWHRGYQKVAY